MLMMLSSHQVYEKVAYLLTNLGEPHPSLPHFHSALPPRWLADTDLLLPLPPPVLLRAPADRVRVGEQLLAQDVPLPVCQLEQLHVLHRFLPGKVGGRLPCALRPTLMFHVNTPTSPPPSSPAKEFISDHLLPPRSQM